MTTDQLDALRLILAPAVEKVAQHDWPADLTPDAECLHCGLAYGEWVTA